MTRTLLLIAVLSGALARAGDEPPAFVLKWGSTGSGPGEFNAPGHLAVDAVGNVYVADILNHRVQKFDSLGVYLTEWGSFGSQPGQFDHPRSIAIDSDAEVFVGDGARVQVFSGDGVYLRHWILGLDRATGLDVDSGGNVYVASEPTNRVLKYSNQGALLTFWGSKGVGEGEFLHPNDVAVDGQDDVYVDDRERIEKFTSDGEFILQWGTFGQGDGQFYTSLGLAIDGDNNVYATDADTYRVQKFTATGSYLTQWGTPGSGDGEFNFAVGIAIAPSGEIFVADSNADRIQKFAYVSTAVEPQSWGRIKSRYRSE